MYMYLKTQACEAFFRFPENHLVSYFLSDIQVYTLIYTLQKHMANVGLQNAGV